MRVVAAEEVPTDDAELRRYDRTSATLLSMRLCDVANSLWPLSRICSCWLTSMRNSSNLASSEDGLTLGYGSGLGADLDSESDSVSVSCEGPGSRAFLPPCRSRR